MDQKVMFLPIHAPPSPLPLEDHKIICLAERQHPDQGSSPNPGYSSIQNE